MKNILLIAALLLIIIITGCTDKESGIFYSIEEERALEDNTIDNDASIGSMLYYGGSYYVAAGDVFSVNALENLDYHLGNGGGKWRRNTETPEDTLCFSIALINGSIYGVFYAKNDSTTETSSDLYRLEDDTWTRITLPDGLFAVEILASNDNSFGFFLGYSYNDTEGSGRTRVYSIYHYDGNILTEISDGLGYSITTAENFDVALDNDTAAQSYWITCGPRLFTLPSSTPTADLTEFINVTLANSDYETEDTFQCIHYTEIFGGLILAKADDKGYFRADDGSWVELDNEFTYTVEDFYDFTPSGGQEVLLMASASGYFELSSADSEGYNGSFIDPVLTAKESTYDSLALDAATVNTFFSYIMNEGETDEQNILFALTQDSGLWSNGFYDGSDTDRVWDIE